VGSLDVELLEMADAFLDDKLSGLIGDKNAVSAA
jgi:hypothetical protein